MSKQSFGNVYFVYHLFCLPLGIVAIVKSTSVERLWREGRHDEARRAADYAKKCAMWAIIIPLVFMVIYIIAMLAIGASVFPFLNL